MIIVAMSCHNGIYVRYIFRQDGELHRQRHVIAFQQRINHEDGTPAVHHESRHTQPADSRPIDRLKASKPKDWVSGALIWYF